MSPSNASPGYQLIRIIRWADIGVAALMLLLALAWPSERYGHVSNRVDRWWNNLRPGTVWQHRQPHDDGLWLPDYRFDILGRAVTGVDDNLSGLAFDADQQQLLAVINRPSQVLVLDTDGHVLDRHRVLGASDTEAIAWLGGDRIALLQERRRSVLLLSLPKTPGAAIDASSARTLPLGLAKSGNHGPEGLGYDRSSDSLYVAKERAPRGLYRIRGVSDATRPTTTEDLGAWLEALPFATDLSGVEVDPRSGHLLLLSDESQLLVELDEHGRPSSWRSVVPPGWTLPPPQPEGVTVDDNGTIYLVSEPNLFYRLQSPQRHH